MPSTEGLTATCAAAFTSINYTRGRSLPESLPIVLYNLSINDRDQNQIKRKICTQNQVIIESETRIYKNVC